MEFDVRSDHPSVAETDHVPGESGQNGNTFTSEQEMQEIAGPWPMQRLVEIWNGLPRVRPVRKFENRKIAMARIWRAMQGNEELRTQAVASRGATVRSRIAFREGSKAAQVCSLLSHAEGATLNQIRAVTGWQAHTVRGFISRTLRKQGRKVRSFRKNGERVYRLKS
jgi:hypothetical protein